MSLSPERRAIAEGLRALREAHYTQQGLADELGVSRNTVWRWETTVEAHNNVPNAAHIRDLARLYALSSDFVERLGRGIEIARLVEISKRARATDTGVVRHLTVSRAAADDNGLIITVGPEGTTVRVSRDRATLHVGETITLHVEPGAITLNDVSSPDASSPERDGNVPNRT